MADSKTVVIGAGSAGLAVSHELRERGVDHAVLERGRPGESWRGRWDGFFLNTPNWTVSLPGQPYAGDRPQGFMSREEIGEYLDTYAASSPVTTGVEVTGLTRAREGDFVLHASSGDIRAQQVVVATGTYQRAHHPIPRDAWPDRLLVIDAGEYRRPADLPDGRVLILGSGQTGVQIAEKLGEAGREVTLSCGRAPWTPRRLEGLDIVDWLNRIGWFDHPASTLPSPGARLAANVLTSGTHGGHDLNLRTLRAAGVRLAGHVRGVAAGHVEFAPDLPEIAAFGDARYGDMCAALRKLLPEAGYQCPDLPAPEPWSGAGPESLSLAEFGTVIYSTGYRPDYSWIDVGSPVVDDLGFPLAIEGASTATGGLYFAGVHWLRKRKSSLLFGVGEDAAVVAGQVAGERTQRD